MKIVLLSTLDTGGGAARAAFRLHQGLRLGGAEAVMLVQAHQSDDPHVIPPQGKLGRGLAALRPTLEQLPLALGRRAIPPAFSSEWFPDGLARRVENERPDVVNIHWVQKGFLRIETLPRLPAPRVLTLHDMWAFTGGCHYTGGCERFRQRCGCCPQLAGPADSLPYKEGDLSRRVWRRKQKSWSGAEFTVVTPSRWLAGQAAQSSLFAGRRIEVIPNGLDTERFRPLPKTVARDWLGLPSEKKLILFSAVHAAGNPNKGFQLLPAIFTALAEGGRLEGVELLVLGEAQPEAAAGFPFPVRLLGHLHDEVSLALAYNAADVFLAPSQQDNLPNTVMEALACGVPCVAANAGGIPEMVEPQVNGYLAAAGEPQDYARGIQFVLGDPERYPQLAAQARRKAVDCYDYRRQARRYLDLFAELGSAQAGEIR